MPQQQDSAWTLTDRSSIVHDIPLESVDVQTPKLKDAKSPDYLSFARAGEARLVIVLKQPVRVHGLFGIDREVSRIGLFLDEVGTFRAALDQRRHDNQLKCGGVAGG
jgi:hypothetical protein